MNGKKVDLSVKFNTCKFTLVWTKNNIVWMFINICKILCNWVMNE